MFYSQRKKFLVTAIVIIFIFSLLNLFQNQAQSLFYLVSSPIQRFLWQSGEKMSSFVDSFLRCGKLERENQKLKIKNEELNQKLMLLHSLEEENKMLRESLNIGIEKDFALSMVDVVEKDVSQGSILINKGSKDGILKGMPVITAQKILVGRVKDVYSNFSRVDLISNKKISFNAVVGIERDNQGKNNEIMGIVKGNGHLGMFMDFIPLKRNIFPGEFVFTSSLGRIFPKNLLVGRIEKVEKRDIESFQKVSVKPVFDIRSLDELFVITNY